MPPVRGNADATSASVSAPHNARMPPATHTAINAVGVGSRFAIAAGERKMPQPTAVPTTTTSASNSPMRRGSDSRKETNLSAGVPEQKRLLLTPPASRHRAEHRGESFRRIRIVDEEALGPRGRALGRAREIRRNTVSLPDELVAHHEPRRAEVLPEQLAHTGHDITHARRQLPCR